MYDIILMTNWSKNAEILAWTQHNWPWFRTIHTGRFCENYYCMQKWKKITMYYGNNKTIMPVRNADKTTLQHFRCTLERYTFKHLNGWSKFTFMRRGLLKRDFFLVAFLSILRFRNECCLIKLKNARFMLKILLKTI